MGTRGCLKGALLLALVIASLITPLLLLSPSPVHAALTPHDPIYIEGNDNFTFANGVNGGGSGTENDPYIIENWAINTEHAIGFDMRDTTAYFVIKNCLVENGSKNYNFGFRLDNVKNGRVENCIVRNNLEGIILMSDSSNNTILSNFVNSNHNTGILLSEAPYNTIVNNIVSINQYGIKLSNSSNNNTVTNNNVVNNNYDPNHYGIIIILNSDNNRIYHNNFENNENQAYDTSTNYWDNGYPWGGNYWSDYTGDDNYRGENQNLSGSDRIGDTPYYIPGDNNLDRYPLMNPSPSWTGWARVHLTPPPEVIPLVWPSPCLYLKAVALEMNLALYQGSKLVLKFYTWGDTFQGENVVWSGTTPDNVSFSKIVPHPEYGWVKKVRLDLTYNNTENVISTITSFTVRKVDLEIMFLEIPLWWALASPEERVCLEILFSQIPLYWALAPP